MYWSSLALQHSKSFTVQNHQQGLEWCIHRRHHHAYYITRELNTIEYTLLCCFTVQSWKKKRVHRAGWSHENSLPASSTDGQVQEFFTVKHLTTSDHTLWSQVRVKFEIKLNSRGQTFDMHRFFVATDQRPSPHKLLLCSWLKRFCECDE